MWASGTRFEGTCTSKILCMDWMGSQDSRGGWLATGCSEGTVGVSWISNPEWNCDAAEMDDERDTATGGATRTPENMACTEEASYYKSHFVLKGHLGEVRSIMIVLKQCRPMTFNACSFGFAKYMICLHRVFCA